VLEIKAGEPPAINRPALKRSLRESEAKEAPAKMKCPQKPKPSLVAPAPAAASLKEKAGSVLRK
jgi:hypothetical protein